MCCCSTMGHWYCCLEARENKFCAVRSISPHPHHPIRNVWQTLPTTFLFGIEISQNSPTTSIAAYLIALAVRLGSQSKDGLLSQCESQSYLSIYTHTHTHTHRRPRTEGLWTRCNLFHLDCKGYASGNRLNIQHLLHSTHKHRPVDPATSFMQAFFDASKHLLTASYQKEVARL